MNQQYDPFGRPTNGAVPPNNGQTPPGQTPYNNYNNPGGYPPPGNSYRPPYRPYGQAPYGPDPRQAAYFEQENRRRAARRAKKQELRRFGNCIGLAILAYFILQLLFTQLLSVFHLYDTYQNSTVFQSCFNLLFVSVCSVAAPFGVMALINRGRYTGPVIPTHSVSAGQMGLWVSFGMLCCVGANFVVTFGVIPLFKAFGYGLKSSSTDDPNSIFACVIALIGTAIVPAICEEFAMRCCCVQLLRKYGKGFAVLSISIVFGLLHGNVIQFVFAFLVGLILGYITVKTDSVVPAILVHALNNGMSVVASIVRYAATDAIADSVTVGMYVFWLLVGAAATIYLLAKKQLYTPKAQTTPDPEALTLGQCMGAFFGTPGMIISFIPLVLLTISTIQEL